MLRLLEDIEISIEQNGTKDTTADTIRYRCSSTGTSGEIKNDLSYQPKGIRSVATSLGVKKSGKSDFTVVLLPEPAPAAGVFTKNLCPGYCITHNRKILDNPLLQAVVVNSGNANVFTPNGAHDLEDVLSLVASEFGVKPNQILYCSTGVIGVPLPLDLFRKGIPGLATQLQENNIAAAADAILTTDLGTKVASTRVGDVTLCGIAKGAGMIEPDMATMLSFFFTDIDLSPAELQSCLEQSSQNSFNCISVDSDTSTSDAVSLHSTGKVKVSEKDKRDFLAALQAMSIKLARDVISQGEGVSRIIEVGVDTDISSEVSSIMAKKLINSPLVKTAIHGADPNWGRIVMAIGKPHPLLADTLIPEDQIQIEIQGVTVYNKGKQVQWSHEQLACAMRDGNAVSINVRIGSGGFPSYAWGCDLSAEYVRINADYTT